MKRDSVELPTDLGTPPTTQSGRPRTDRTETRPQPDRALTPEDAEARFVGARDAWLRAMRASSSGKPADLAALAIAQEAYEAAAEERAAWASGARVAIPVDPNRSRKALEVAVGQELAWRKVHDAEPPQQGLIGRIRRRLGR